MNSIHSFKTPAHGFGIGDKVYLCESPALCVVDFSYETVTCSWRDVYGMIHEKEYRHNCLSRFNTGSKSSSIESDDFNDDP